MPMLEPSGQLAGLASKVAARQAFWIVSSREGSAIGSARKVLAMFASPGLALTLTMKLVPLALLPWAPASAVSSGLKGRLAQPPTSNGEDTCALAPWAAVSFAETSSAARFVGL